MNILKSFSSVFQYMTFLVKVAEHWSFVILCFVICSSRHSPTTKLVLPLGTPEERLDTVNDINEKFSSRIYIVIQAFLSLSLISRIFSRESFSCCGA